MDVVEPHGDSVKHVRSWAVWTVLALILAAGVVTRFLFLDQVYLWIDETSTLQGGLWADYGPGLRGFLRGLWRLPRGVYRTETANGTWVAAVYAICRTVGSPTLWWARLPSAVAGVLLLAILFILTRRVSGSSAAGLFAAGAAAVSIVQIHYAQQAFSYGPAVLAGALVIWAAVAWVGSLDDKGPSSGHLPRGFLFFIAVIVAAALHNCTLPVIAACLGVIGGSVLWKWSRKDIDRSAAVRNLASLLQVGLMVVLCVTFFVLPKMHEGFRGYLAPYYAPTEWREASSTTDMIPAISGFLFRRSYDLVSYSLNTVYNYKWYQPLGLNALAVLPAILALFGLVCLWRRGGRGRTFAIIALASGVLVAIGALSRRYPFGGVRQCLPLTVFVYASAGMGAAAVYREFKPAGVGLAVAWIAVWLIALPSFYAQRRSPCDTASLLEHLRLSGTRRLAAADPMGCPERDIFKYYLRDHPEIAVLSIGEAVEDLKREGKAFVFASTSRNLQELKSLWNPGDEFALEEQEEFARLLSEKTITADALIELAKNPVPSEEAQNSGQSIYTPLNGLFLYKIERGRPLEGLR